MRCKPGDLAIITRADSDSRNVGLMCKVLRAAERSKWDRFGCEWEIEAAGSPFVVRNSESPFARCPDAWLLPIRPEREPEALDTDMTIEVEVLTLGIAHG